eukprot:6202666-Pleurochrysis_carterae.AAC.1
MLLRKTQDAISLARQSPHASSSSSSGFYFHVSAEDKSHSRSIGQRQRRLNSLDFTPNVARSTVCFRGLQHHPIAHDPRRYKFLDRPQLLEGAARSTKRVLWRSSRLCTSHGTRLAATADRRLGLVCCCEDGGKGHRSTEKGFLLLLVPACASIFLGQALFLVMFLPPTLLIAYVSDSDDTPPQRAVLLASSTLYTLLAVTLQQGDLQAPLLLLAISLGACVLDVLRVAESVQPDATKSAPFAELIDEVEESAFRQFDRKLEERLAARRREIQRQEDGRD